VATVAKAIRPAVNENNDIAQDQARACDQHAVEANNTQPPTMYKVVVKFMNQVSKGRDEPRDAAFFMLSGGRLVYNTTKTQFCSVKQVDLSDLAETSNGNDNVSSGSSKHYTWKHLLRGYRQRLETHPDIDLSDVTLYVYAAKYHSGQEVAPWFAGFNAKPMWPLEEDFSKTMLMLHYPWTDVVEETKHGANTFAECLENYSGTTNSHGT